MKVLLSVLVLCFCQTWGFGQNSQPIQVSYLFRHLQDTVAMITKEEEMALQVNSTSSVYFSLSQKAQEKRMKEVMEKQMAAGNYNFHLGQVKTYIRQFRHANFAAKQMVIENPFQNKIYVYSDSLPEINWLLEDSTKSFGGLICQKAVAHYGGRNYTAWFAPSIPVPAGPWNLNGLPGLIVEAYDDQRQVQFLFQGMTTSFEPHVMAASPVYTTNERFFTMLEAQRNHPGAGANGGMNFTVTPNSNAANKNPKSVNPLIRTKP